MPFRLTENMVDAMGVTGVDGVFRRACEISLDVLREHKDSMISVLEAFIHDPLVEWNQQKNSVSLCFLLCGQLVDTHTKRMVVQRKNKTAVSPLHLGEKALKMIRLKLEGKMGDKASETLPAQNTVSQVEQLINEAVSPYNLVSFVQTADVSYLSVCG